MQEKYRPSNSTEGDLFHAGWCEHCARYQDEITDEYCPILGATFAFSIKDPEYPSEWVHGEYGPECTAFTSDGAPVRCERTIDMFNDMA